MNVSDTLAIGSNVTLELSLDPGSYSIPTSYTIATAGTAVTGQFTTKKTNARLYQFQVKYLPELSPTEIVIELISVPL